MGLINRLMGSLFDLLFLPFRSFNPWAGMVFISLLTGLLMLLIYRWTSNQTGIRRVKDKIKAHLLELRLYKDNMGVTMKAQGQILKANLRYLGLNLKPLLVMIIPLILILAQLNLWFGSEPLTVGKPALVKIRVGPNVDITGTEFSIKAPDAILVETSALRIDEQKEINWRVKPAAAGRFNLIIQAGDKSYEKTVIVDGRKLQKVSPLRVKRGIWDELLYPGEKPLPGDGQIRTIEVVHSGKRLSLFGLRLHWLVAYLLLSIVFGFALKKPFGVEI